MKMRLRRYFTLMLCLALALCVAPAVGEAEKLVDGDVTITYMIPEHANQPLLEDAGSGMDQRGNRHHH